MQLTDSSTSSHRPTILADSDDDYLAALYDGVETFSLSLMGRLHLASLFEMTQGFHHLLMFVMHLVVGQEHVALGVVEHDVLRQERTAVFVQIQLVEHPLFDGRQILLLQHRFLFIE